MTAAQVSERAERRAAPKPAPAGPETRPALRPSMLAQASMEPRPSFPSGERRRTSSSRLLGNCPLKRPSACKPMGRPVYPPDEGLH